MPLKIIRNDITKVKADAIVNTANPRPVIGGGTDRAVYTAAGADKVLAERKAIGDIMPGNAAYTRAFALDAKYIIHTVGPAWEDGSHGERDILHSCYKNSLELAAELSCESAAFPLIATGVYGFPKDEALQIALGEINRFLLSHDMLVYLVVFDADSFRLSGKLVGDIEEYIDEKAARVIREAEFSLDRAYEARTLNSRVFTGFSAEKSREKSLDEILSEHEKTFQQKLFELIDARGISDVEVYKKANLTRKLFSSIRCNPGCRPKKATVAALAVALKLNMEEFADLLARAGYALSPSDRS
ncbi:MAG: macro domain-containing protein, partial [Firmicutes bacterium]|nr:macro domain-containing protein [Bacillota bacterium]